MKANSMCISCLLAGQEKKIRNFPDEERKSAYMQKILKLLYDRGREDSAPLLYQELMELFEAEWGFGDELSEVKRKFNLMLLDHEAEIEAWIKRSDDPIKNCISYVCAANYIDFAALDSVSEDTLNELIRKADTERVPEDEYQSLRRDLDPARSLVYLTDNCGEIVLDKIFIKLIKEAYPNLSITAIVRGRSVINDATMEDAREIGLVDVADCIGNGDGSPGTVLTHISEEAKKLIMSADVIISKGQGNFESLYGEPLTPYFLFMCKCELFVRRFGMKQFESVFRRGDRIKIADTSEQ